MPSHRDIQNILESTDLLIDRSVSFAIEDRLKHIECITLLGPRQIGKTRLANSHFVLKRGAVYRDLEDRGVREEIGYGRVFFEKHKNRIIILDEIQECEYLFKNIKAFIDRQRSANNKDCRFLLFGSASLDLQRKAFSSLAGRVNEMEMSGILPTELISALSGIIPSDEEEALLTYRRITELLMFRGGMPLSLFAESDQESLNIRTNFVDSYVRKDIENYGLNVDRATLEECLSHIAKVNGKQFNIGTFTRNLIAGRKEVQNTIEALEQLLLIRAIEPWSDINGFSVRVTRHTKMYLRDSGLLLSLLGIRDLASLLNSKHLEMVWEGFVIESVIATAIGAGKFYKCAFYRTHGGSDELDLIVEFWDGSTWGFEIKLSEPEHVSSGNIRAANAVGVDRRLVIHNGTGTYDLNGGFKAMPLHQALNEILQSK